MTMSKIHFADEKKRREKEREYRKQEKKREKKGDANKMLRNKRHLGHWREEDEKGNTVSTPDP